MKTTFKNTLFFVFFLCFVALQAQQKKDIIFTIDGKPTGISEFSRVYEKNKDIVTEESEKDVVNYLDLFINYKLKLLEAYALDLDKQPHYIKELASYKKQLIKPYLKDSKVTDVLVKEAYNRTVKEVNASHILIRLPKNPKPVDTLKAYTKILNIRKQIIQGEDFETIAKTHSQDPSAKENGGNLGYFSAFKMVYPFETASYTTKKGKVSMPFRTQFGYHIVKVNNFRPTKGQIEVAHIMLKGTSEAQKEKINKIYTQLEAEKDFEYFATKFSEDKVSAVNGGKLKKFGSGDMIPEFEDVAYAIVDEGALSKPFKTTYGYHIVKLIKKHEVPNFEELKPTLVKKIEKDTRSQLITNSLINNLKNKFTITENAVLLKTIYSNKEAKKIPYKDVLLTINSKKILVENFVAPLERRKTQITEKHYNKFKETQILTYYKENLENLDESFAIILQEYKDGLLLFDLLQKKVWDASNDTIALKTFYKKNVNNYQWKQRVVADVATCNDANTAKNLKEFLTNGMSLETINQKIDAKNILFNSGKFEIESKQLPINFEAVKGVSKVYKDKKHYIVVFVKEVLPAQTKSFLEIKGKVINDFQLAIEKNWIQELRSKHTVEIHNKALKKIVKKYNK